MAVAVAIAGCGGEKSTGPQPVAGTISLAPGAYTLVAGAAAAGPLLFPAADSAGAEYLVVGQLATGVGDVSDPFALAGATPAPAAGAPAAARRVAARRPFALRFHATLLRLDAAAARASRAPARGTAAAVPFRGPPALGSQRTFVVCADAYCEGTATVTATVRYVGSHSAIYVDDSAPAGGYQAGDLQQLGAQFDSVLYPVDTAAFGAPSDIDGNGVVLLLLTPAVNVLTPAAECGSSMVIGYFLGYDLAPATRRVYNDGEIFYGVVPDPDAEISCALTTAQALTLTPPTLVHEFQHMISFNQHVLLRGGGTEQLWLDEALSDLGEELVGQRYDSLGDSAAASAFLFDDEYDAFAYLLDPAAHPMVTLVPPGTQQGRGADWLFVRYLADRFGPDLPGRLERSALSGDANVVGATGVPFATLLGRWALALYVSDLPGFTPDSALRYSSWDFRTAFGTLHERDPVDFFTAFPLAPGSTSAAAFSLAGTVSSGSGAYLLVTQAPRAAALTLTFTTPGGGALPSSGNPQLAIVRIR